MFCTKCGNQLSNDAAFCNKCGANLKTDATTPQRPQECTVRFLPKKVFGQWMLRKAVINIGGNTYTTKIKKPIDLILRAGSYNLLAYGAYLGQACKIQLTYDFEPEKQYLIRYKTRIFIFSKGKIQIEEYPGGVALPKK